VIVDTNGKVLRTVSDLDKKGNKSNEPLEVEDVFFKADWQEQGFRNAAVQGSYTIGSGSMHTPDIRVVDNDEGQQDGEDEDMVLMGQEHHSYTKPSLSKPSGLYIKTAPRGELGSHAYEYMKVGSSLSLPTNPSIPQPISAYPASNSAPGFKPVVGLPASARLVKPGDQLLSHFHSLSHRRATYPADLGHIADSNFSIHYSISNPRSLSAPSHAGPSRFPGAYVDDNRATVRGTPLCYALHRTPNAYACRTLTLIEHLHSLNACTRRTLALTEHPHSPNAHQTRCLCTPSCHHAILYIIRPIALLPDTLYIIIYCVY